MTTNDQDRQTNGAGKAAIVVLADPDDSSDESVGRIVNALATAYDFHQNGAHVQILFQGTGTRWVAALQDDKHPAHGLYGLVRDQVAGVSSLCADAFGGREDAREAGIEVLDDNAVPGTPGLPSLYGLAAAGYTVLTF